MLTFILIVLLLILLALIAPKAVKGFGFLLLVAFGTLFLLVGVGYMNS